MHHINRSTNLQLMSLKYMRRFIMLSHRMPSEQKSTFRTQQILELLACRLKHTTASLQNKKMCIAQASDIKEYLLYLFEQVQNACSVFQFKNTYTIRILKSASSSKTNKKLYADMTKNTKMFLLNNTAPHRLTDLFMQ